MNVGTVNLRVIYFRSLKGFIDFTRFINVPSYRRPFSSKDIIILIYPPTAF